MQASALTYGARYDKITLLPYFRGDNKRLVRTASDTDGEGMVVLNERKTESGGGRCHGDGWAEIYNFAPKSPVF